MPRRRGRRDGRTGAASPSPQRRAGVRRTSPLLRRSARRPCHVQSAATSAGLRLARYSLAVRGARCRMLRVASGGARESSIACSTRITPRWSHVPSRSSERHGWSAQVEVDVRSSTASAGRSTSWRRAVPTASALVVEVKSRLMSVEELLQNARSEGPSRAQDRPASARAGARGGRPPGRVRRMTARTGGASPGRPVLETALPLRGHEIAAWLARTRRRGGRPRVSVSQSTGGS